MATPANPVVEEPKPVVTEPPPVEKSPEPAPEPEPKGVEPPPPVDLEKDRQAVDAYLAERDQRERKRRGGKQARIDELTKEKADLEAKAAEAEKTATAAKAEAEAAKAEAAKKAEVKPLETPAERPKMESFTDVDEYHAAMALWAANQKKPEIKQEKPPEPPPIQQIRKEEFDKFLEKGKAFVTRNPDFNAVLEAAHIRGLTMSEGARIAITKLAAPEVAYWLAKPENDMAARTFMGMDEMSQIAEIGKIAERLHVSPADFVSSATPPGTRLNGSNARVDLPLNEITDTDEYIRQRKLQRRQARGR